MYVYKEVWVHPSARWLWMMEDLMSGAPAARHAADSSMAVTAMTAANGEVTIRLTATGAQVKSLTVRADGLVVDRPTRSVAPRPAGAPLTIEWKARPKTAGMPWVAVVIPDGDIARRREVIERP